MRIQINMSPLPRPSSHYDPDFEDRQDFEDANRGFVGKLDPCIIKDTKGNVVWDNDAWDFVNGLRPATVNPKLWRQAQLTSIQGLYQVAPTVYQVRGFDIANMSVIEGDTGVVIVDPLTAAECAEEALKLYRTHRGDRPVLAVIYSHSHTDHFGGALGVLPEDDPQSIPIIAPEGFMEEATSEHVVAGPSMLRRAEFMYGTRLPKTPTGNVGVGLGMGVALGSRAMIPPNKLIAKTGEELTIDGIRFVFQMVPGTEAPAELNFFLPDHGALYISECATHCLHNIVTLRGAAVRDAKAWAQYLDETIELYGPQSSVLFAGHHWPTWGQERIKTLVLQQRDVYSYLHDQTVKLMNQGLNGTEIAEQIVLPPRLQKLWHMQGYYGSVSHNVKGIYQRYMTWFDGNPAHLWQHPPAEEGKRYVQCFGGIENLVSKANAFVEKGDLRFAATLLDHAVSAAPGNRLAADTLASVFETLGYSAENAPWRNFFLTRAMDLRAQSSSSQPATNLTARLRLNPHAEIEDWFDSIAVSIDGLRAAEEFEESQSLHIHIAELRTAWKVTLSNGALTYRQSPALLVEDAGSARLVLRVNGKLELFEILQGNLEVLDQGKAEGNIDFLQRLLKLQE